MVVAIPRRVRLISQGDNKTDHVDAETLAHLGRVDPALLAPVRHRRPAAQADLSVVGARDALVRTRTLLVNHVRGAVKSVGARVPACSTHGFGRRMADAIPDAVRPALAPVLAVIARLNEEIAAFNRRVEQLAEAQYPETAGLRLRPAPTAGARRLTPARTRPERSTIIGLGHEPVPPRRQHTSGKCKDSINPSAGRGSALRPRAGGRRPQPWCRTTAG